MAPSGGILVPMAMRAMRHTLKKVQARLAHLSKPLQQELQPVLARTASKHPLHSLARIKQSKGRWYTTQSTINAAVRRFMSKVGESTAKYDRTSFPASRTASAISHLTARAPFASTLRPNLTGGAIPRTAGGNSLGGGAGGARYFSHTPAAPAQVISNVTAACRAFWLSGQKAEFNGVTSTGDKRFRAVSALREETGRKLRLLPKSTPGSSLDFRLDPTITALSRLGATQVLKTKEEHTIITTLNTEGFLDVLSVDFTRTLKDFAAIMNDMKRLASLGDLPITLKDSSTLRIRFPGCDAESVERLCDEVGVQRGVIQQDSDFMQKVGGEVALMFPFASTSEHTLSSPGGSLRSQSGHDMEELKDFDNLWVESYESMDEGEVSYERPSQLSSGVFEGVEGLYRFLEQCDNARRI